MLRVEQMCKFANFQQVVDDDNISNVSIIWLAYCIQYSCAQLTYDWLIYTVSQKKRLNFETV